MTALQMPVRMFGADEREARQVAVYDHLKEMEGRNASFVS